MKEWNCTAKYQNRDII